MEPQHVETLCLCKTIIQSPYKVAKDDDCKTQCSPCKEKGYTEKCCSKFIRGFISQDGENSDELTSRFDIRHKDSLLQVRRAMSTQDDYRNLVKRQILQRRGSSLWNNILIDGTSLRKVCIFRAPTKLCPPPVSHMRKSIMKSDCQRVILVPSESHVFFSNFKMNKLYKKTVTLQNVSNSPAKFQIKSRDVRSKFVAMIKSKNNRNNIISAGMQMKLIIFFRCDVVDDPNELLVINVQNGRTVIIRLHAYRDPPILRVQEIKPQEDPKDEQLCPPTERITISTDSWRTHMHFPSTSRESTDDSSITLPKSLEPDRKRLASSNFDCGKCFVGEVTCTVLKFQNLGYEGRFFIMSDIDWSSMHVEDVNDNNTLTLPPFTIKPAYFSLKSNEELLLTSSFSPESDGMHVSKLYILSDNLTLITTDIIGDGVVYDPDFIQIDQAIKKFSTSGLYVDNDSRYYVKIEIDPDNRMIHGEISVANVSEIHMRFRWEKRRTANETYDVNHLPIDLLNIHPSCGIFVPFSIHRFTLNGDASTLSPDQYLIIFQLFVEDIPIEAIPTGVELHTRKCYTRRRKCSASVDVWVDDIELRLKHYYSDGEDVYEKFKDDISSHLFDDDDTFSFLSDIKCLSNNDECVDTSEFDSGSRSNEDMLELTMDELCANKDRINLERIKSALMGYIFTAGVMRISKRLYVGIKETFTLILTNKSLHPLMYEWGNVTGADDNKLNVSFTPKKREVLPYSIQSVEITLLPTKEGEVRSLYAACCFGNSKNILILGIECSITPFNVTFIFPTNDITKPFEGNETRVNWQADSLKVAFALASKYRRQKAILNKFKLQEELELEIVNLDEGDVHKDIAAGPSEDDLKNDSQTILDQYSSEMTDNTPKTGEEFETSFSGTTSEKDTDSPGPIIPFYKRVIPRSSKSIVIEFENLAIGTVQKKKIEIINETPVSSNFRVTIKNYYPLKNKSENKENEERIISMYKKAYSRDYHEDEETLSRIKRPNVGVVIQVCPSKSEISPFGRLVVLISVYADTWGTYIDELMIDITGLPRYTLGICLQVVGSPIMLPLPKNQLTKAYIFRFGSIKLGSRLENRHVTVKNTSAVPIVINWHTFLIHPNINEQPFNIILDLYTPFTDLLAAHIRTQKSTCTTQSVVLSNFQGYTSSMDSRIMSNLYSSTTSSDWSTYTDSDSIVTNYDGTFTSDYLIIPTSSESTRAVTNSIDYNNKIQQAVAETDIRISIVPYYGMPDSTSCVINPRETVVPPKQISTVSISLKPDSVSRRNSKKLQYKILGILRIAPIDKFRDYCYSREDGHYHPPIEIDLDAEFTIPRLYFDIPESEATFTFSASAVMESPKQMLKMRKTFCFYNCENDSINVNFETHEPFRVQKISSYLEGPPPETFSSISVNGQSEIEVDVTCMVDSQLILLLLNDDRYQDLHGSKIMVKESLIITHADKMNQAVELNLHIILPSINVLSHSLDFGHVHVGCERTMVLTIENATVFKQSFKIKKKYNNNDFVIYEDEGEIPGSDRRTCNILIKFVPTKPGRSLECLEIHTALPNYVEDAALCGEGTLDEKYYYPGF